MRVRVVVAGVAALVMANGLMSIPRATATERCHGRSEADLSDLRPDTGGVPTSPLPLAVQAELGEINAELLTSDGFGGTLILADGSVCIARLSGASGDRVVQRFSRASAELRRSVAFFKVSHSRAELDRTLNTITSQLDQVENTEGVRINVAYTDLFRDTVQVGIQPYDPTTVGRLRRRFTDLPVSFYDAPPPEHLDHPQDTRDSLFPLEGGVALRRLDIARDQYNVCSAAFAAQAPGGVLGGPRRNILLTAGHCVGAMNETWEWRAGGMIGYVDAFRFDGQTDGASITTFTDVRNTIHINDTVKRSVRSVQSTATDTPGQYICISARESGSQCTTIFNTNATMNFTGGPSITNARIANIPALPGDSGGSVYQETGNGIAAAAGIISARVTYADGAVRMGYTHIEYITRDLGVQIQTTPN